MDVSNKRKILSKIAFGCSLAIVLDIALLYFYNVVKWMTLPDYGYGFRTAIGVRIVGVVSEVGQGCGSR